MFIDEVASSPDRSLAARAIELLLRRRIGAREAVTRDLPATVSALLENEELLIAFGALRAGRVDGERSRRIRAHECPVRRHLIYFGYVKLEMQRDRLEHRGVSLPHRR